MPQARNIDVQPCYYNHRPHDAQPSHRRASVLLLVSAAGRVRIWRGQPHRSRPGPLLAYLGNPVPCSKDAAQQPY